MMALLGRHVLKPPQISSVMFRPASRASFSSEAQDTLVWPPPRTDDSIALQRLVEAQKLAEKKKKSVQPREDGAALDASASSRQQESMKKQKGFQGTASSSAGRVTELVRGLLATRDIEMCRMDRESIEKLRVVDLRQLLAVLTLPQGGLKSSLVDRVWKAAKVERVKDWSTALPRSQRKQWKAFMEAEQPFAEEEALHTRMPFSHIVTGKEVAGMLEDAKADNVTVLDVRPRQCDFTDEIVIATARSKLHCQSAAQAVVYRLKQSCKEIAPGIPPRIEGMGVSHHANTDWLVVDCGSVVAHIFDGHEARMQYNLERLWAAPPSAELDTQSDSSYALQSMS